MMKDLMMNEDFSDVTLVTEDKKQIKANISVLSACSPVFKDIFKKEKNSNQIMYLRGIQFSEMESIMQFIYLGEATFYKERMDEFLAVAKSLEIKELCNAGPMINDEPDDEPAPGDPVTPTETLEEQTDKIITQTLDERKVDINAFFYLNNKYECLQCQKTYYSKRTLVRHNRSVHEGVKYACDQCDYRATREETLTWHIQSKHDGIRYACEQCDYQASHQKHLKEHIQSIHEGIKYACDQCDHQFGLQSSLTRHIKSMHEGVKYACNQCDYQFTQQSSLNVHIKTKHEDFKLK